MSGLSLWQIDQDLADLMELRADIMHEDPPGDTTAVDGAIEEYVTEVIPHKVDAIAGQFRHWDNDLNAAKAEQKRVNRVIKSIEGRVKRLESVCIAVMERRGDKRLAGGTSVLRIQGNGGQQKLEIYDAVLLPLECRTVIVRMTTEQFERFGGGARFPRFNVEPDESGIRKELSTPCEHCGGSGSVMTDEAEQYEAVAIPAAIKVDCEHCGGTGFRLVPGARLLPRGLSLRVDSR